MALAMTPAAPGTAGGLDLDEPQDLDRPNILFIITDDQRGGLGVMPKTAQYFKREGRSYPNAFATTPLCCPSRASIMTGRYSHNHGVKTNTPLPDALSQEDTLQAKLQPLGYSTAMYGKWLGGWGIDRSLPHFDDFAFLKPGYVDTTWNVNGEVMQVPGYTTEILGGLATDFIESQAGSGDPWLMYVTPYAPHAPHTPEEIYAGAEVGHWKGNPAVRETDKSDKPWFLQRGKMTFKKARGVRTRQFRTLMSVDDAVDDIFGALSASGQDDNTLAVFISDNGYLWGEHGLARKGLPYTAAVKVPMYARWPSEITPGTIDRRLVGNIDLAPTVLSLLGLSTGALDGRNLLDDTWERDRMHLEYWCNTRKCMPWSSTRTKSYQYTEYYNEHLDVVAREYYDLGSDRWQLRNLFGDRQRKNDPDVEPLTAKLQLDSLCSGTTTLTACP